MVAEEDTVLVQACLEGNEKAFERLVDQYMQPVYNVALRMVNDSDDAADIAQSVFIKAYTKLHTYDGRFKLFSWLYRMSINESINFLKKRRRFQSLEDDLPSQDENVEAHLDHERLNADVQKCLMELKADYRTVLVLRHFHDLSYEEMGNVLGVPEKTVKSRLFTARQQLKDILCKKGVR